MPEVVFPGLGQLALAGLHWTSYTTVRAPGVFGPSLGRGCCVLHLFLCFVLHFAESFKEPQPNLCYPLGPVWQRPETDNFELINRGQFSRKISCLASKLQILRVRLTEL